jgi:hypothetical protein
VDDIDPQGKVALSPVGEDGDVPAGGGGDAPPARERSRDRAPAAETPGEGREFVSFEAQFEAQAKEKFGDLGPADVAAGRPESDAPRRNRDRDRRRR